MLHVCRDIHVDERELDFSAIRAQGAGGQNVNKVSSAVHLRFDIPASGLPPDCKAALLACGDRRISGDGVVVIKAQVHRSQEQNRAEAVARLLALIRRAATPAAPRRPTRPTKASRLRRMQGKALRGQVKRLRARPGGEPE